MSFKLNAMKLVRIKKPALLIKLDFYIIYLFIFWSFDMLCFIKP